MNTELKEILKSISWNLNRIANALESKEVQSLRSHLKTVEEYNNDN